LSHGQNYILRELRVLFGASTDEDQKAMINLLEKSFRGDNTRRQSGGGAFAPEWSEWRTAFEGARPHLRPA